MTAPAALDTMTFPVVKLRNGYWRARGIDRCPARYAVYRLICQGKTLYVGRSAHVARRVGWHLTARPGLVDTVRVTGYATAEDMLDAEARLIHELHPLLNNLCPVCLWPRYMALDTARAPRPTPGPRPAADAPPTAPAADLDKAAA